MLSLNILSQPGMHTWIAVADGSRANIYETATVERNAPPTGSGRDPSDTHAFTMTPIPGMEMSATPIEAYDLNRHAPAQKPRGQKDGAPMSGGEPKEATQDQIRKEFSVEISEALNRASDQGKFTQLIVIASPAMLGQIKGHLNKQTTAKMIASHAADFTHFKGPELLKRVNHLFQPEKMAS